MSQPEENHQETLERLRAAFADLVPQNRALGLELFDFDRAASSATMRLPYRPELAGDPRTGVLHGGAITTLLDACAGAAVFVRLWSPDPIATLDLRIDYLRPATPGRDTFARAVCYHVTRSVAFVRALAHHGEPERPIASASATFMLGTRGAFAKGHGGAR